MVDSTGGNELVECSQVPLINDLLFPISRSWPFDYMKHQIRTPGITKKWIWWVAVVSLVIVRRFLERLPLLAIMAKDDQRHVFALDQVQEFARTGAQLLFVVVAGPGPAIWGKKALQDDGINRQQHWAGLRQAQQDRLMSRGMPTGLKQREAGQQLGVAINEPVAQCRMIPVNACGSKAWVPAARQFIVFALDDEFRLRKGIVIARMVHVEMGTDEEIDVVRVQAKTGEVLKHIFSILGWWRSWWWRVVRRKSTIDEDVLAIAGLNKIAP